MSPFRRWPRPAAGLAGLLAAAASLSLRQDLAAGGDGLYPGISRFELLSWLGVYGLLLPGLLLLGWALAPLLPRRGPPAGKGAAALLLVLVALGWAAELRFLRWYLLDDRPATLAEGALGFGGRLWAAGRLSAPAFDPAFGFTTAGLERRGQELFPGEAPGALLAAAAASASGLGPLLFALLAAGSGLALALACGRLDGLAGQLVAALLWTLSPMVLLLGIVPGGDLVGRSYLAFAWACWLALAAGPVPPPGRRLGLAAGLGGFAALALATRPAEASCLLLPVFVHLGWLAKDRARRAELPLAGLLAAAGLAAGMFYSRAIGGAFWPAGQPATAGAALAASGSLALLLIFNFAGPLLLPLIGLAFRRGGEVVLAASCALLLLLLRPLALGSAAVQTASSPAADAAAALPLLVLAVAGVAELRRHLAAGGLPARPWAAAGLAASLALPVLASQPLAALGQRSALLRALEAPAAGLEPAIVLVEPVQALWRLRPDLAIAGAWRGELPHPDPFLRDRVIFASGADADPQKLLRAFPRRRLYALRASGGGEPFRLERLR